MIVPAEPLFFRPIYKKTIWGGTALRSRFHRPFSPQETTGESWELASIGADQSIVAEGPLAETTLGRLAEESAANIVGPIAAKRNFPLLYKFIDAHDRLSVQVHPTDAQAQANGWGEFGKTECWYVVDAKENARIVVGFKTGVTREAIGRAIKTASLHELLDFIPVQSGDLLFIPAGTVHAILGGTLLYEVQQASDTTLRLYDWGRVDASGKPRQLHVNDALSVIDTDAHGSYRIPPVIFENEGHSHSYRIACRHFAMEQYNVHKAATISLAPKQSFRVISVIEGTLLLHYPTGSAKLVAGTTVLLPAILREVSVSGDAGTNVLVSSVPDLQKEIIAPLRDRGISDGAIEKLGGFREKNDLVKYLQ